MSAQDDDDLVADLLPAFMEEADEQIASFEQLILELESAPDDPQLLGALFRCAHTVKGSAGVFGLHQVVGFTHHVETVLDHLRDGHIALTPELSSLLLRCNDGMRELVHRAPGYDSDAAVQARDALVASLHAAAGAANGAQTDEATVPTDQGDAAAQGDRVCAIRVNFGPDTYRYGMDPLAIVSYLDRYGEVQAPQCDFAAVPDLDQIDPETCHLAIAFGLRTSVSHAQVMEAFAFVQEQSTIEVTEPTAHAVAPVIPAAPTDEPATTAPPAAVVSASAPAPKAAGSSRPAREGGQAADDGGYIRVLANRLDEVINLLGELVVAGAGASVLAQRTKQRQLIEANQQITRLIEGIRNSTLKLRMVPISETFNRFRRVVRDTAAELGKEVALEIEGGETELDKAVVERIVDPLMHLVRNGLDHGLETPEQREAQGKPRQGHLKLTACHESGVVVIRIIDDGRGIQRHKVLQRAWDRGLVERGVTPPDHDILKLIFEPGFSTAEAVTNLSGRGVGMDVVRSNIEALRGSVAIDSTEGEGSTIEIRLPLTLAIIDGFLVGVGNSRFIFPLESVVEVFSNQRVVTQYDEHGRGVVDLRGHMLPVLDLRRAYALDSPAPERGSIVVVSIGTRRFGVMVDTLLGQHQTVIKPLGKLLRSLRGMSGSSILGTGEVALIFDVDALGQMAEHHPKPHPFRTRMSDGPLTPEASITANGEMP